MVNLNPAAASIYSPAEVVIASNFAFYNFCKMHGALRMTPAMAAGIENTFWTVEDLVKHCGE